MRRPSLVLVAAFLLAFSLITFGQRKHRPPPKPAPEPEQAAPDPAPSPSPSVEPIPAPSETVKIETSLVTIPVIVMDRTGHYLPDMEQDELTIFEDGVQQNIAFFNKVSAPFHVVLMIDTSASTEEKLLQIQAAATAFVEQLRGDDRVKIISFDDQVRELNEFTDDRAQLRSAIAKTRPGQGTKLYDAFGVALDSIRPITGRKAIVIFTDGVDRFSDRATYDGTLGGLDEEGVIVYPIRYDTRLETERMLRQQEADAGPQLPTLGVIRKPPAGTTAPTFPSDDPDSVPTNGTKSNGGIMGLPSPADILRGSRRTNDPRNDPRNDPGRPGDSRLPDDPSRRGNPDPTVNRPINPGNLPGESRRDTRTNDSITSMLDMAYLTGDSYLKALADKSGGRLLRADNLGSLPDAFAKIAAELRTQYSIGYYPTNTARNGLYRSVKVSTSRKNAAVRARPGYRAPTGDSAY